MTSDEDYAWLIGRHTKNLFWIVSCENLKLYLLEFMISFPGRIPIVNYSQILGDFFSCDSSF